MAHIAIELDLGTCPGKQNEEEIMVFIADILFQKEIKIVFQEKETVHTTG